MRERREKENILHKEYIQDARQKFELDPTDENTINFNLAKEKLEIFLVEKLWGIIICTQVPWWEYGEKSSKYFLNLEKRKHVNQAL